MKHAFLIMAHADKDLLQVLVGMLDDVRNDIYLHIDAKWKDFSPSALSVAHAKLYILPERIDGRWGHSSLMDIEYVLFRAAYGRGGYAYYHLLSGADLPIKSQDYIHNFFANAGGQPYIAYWPHYGDVYFKVSRYSFWMEYEKMPDKYRLVSRVIAIARRWLGEAIYKVFGERANSGDFHKGSAWCSLPEVCVGILIDKQQEILKRLRYTRAGDEIFVQTVLYREYFAPRGIDVSTLQDMRYINWRSSVHSPDVFTREDWPAIQASPALFARKFGTTVDREIISLVQAHYGSKTEE